MADQQINTTSSQAQNDLPKTASEAPMSGVEAGEGVSFKDQVKGHAKMFAGKTFGNDAEVEKGAAFVKGLGAEQQTPKQ